MAERAILPDFPNCQVCSYFRASMPGTGLHFFLFLLSPSLFLNFFSLFFISSFIPHTVLLLNTHFSAPPFFSLPSPHRLSPLPLSPAVSPFSKWWVLTYDRLSQVCFNYCKGDGDSTGEEEGKTFVRTLYLRSGG